MILIPIITKVLSFKFNKLLIVIFIISFTVVCIQYHSLLYILYSDVIYSKIASSSDTYVHDITKLDKHNIIPRVVVSLSSFSSRLNHLDKTIHSLFEQTFQVDVVYINIPTELIRFDHKLNNNLVIPTNLDRLIKKYEPKLKIVYTKDYGPATKLLGSLHLENNSQTILITVDDDCVYHRSTFAYLIGTIIHLPHHLIPAFVCEKYWVLTKEWSWRSTRGKCEGFLAAYASVAYRRNYFDKDIFDYTNVPGGCVLHDDVYISGYLYRKGIRPYIIGRRGPFDIGKPWSVLKHYYETNITVGKSNDVRSKQVCCLKYFDYFT